MLRQILRNNRWYYLANEFPVADTDSVVFTINFRCGYRKVLCTSRTVTWRRGRERATQREKRRRREIRCLGATKHVLRRDVYIHSPVARTFFCAQRALTISSGLLRSEFEDQNLPKCRKLKNRFLIGPFFLQGFWGPWEAKLNDHVDEKSSLSENVLFGSN